MREPIYMGMLRSKVGRLSSNAITDPSTCCTVYAHPFSSHNDKARKCLLNNEGERKSANGKGLFRFSQFLEGHIVLEYVRRAAL